MRIRCGPERILADVRAALPRDALITHRRGLEQERRRPAVPDSRAGHDLHAGRLRDDGLRRAGGAGREDREARPRRRRAGRRRRLRPEPGDARHRVRGGRRGRVGDHEQLRVRHDRRPREGALRHDVRHGVREERQAVFARLTRRSPRRTASTASRSTPPPSSSRRSSARSRPASRSSSTS